MSAQTVQHVHELVSPVDVRTYDQQCGRNGHGIGHGGTQYYSPRDVCVLFAEPNEICDDATNSGAQFARRPMRITLRR